MVRLAFSFILAVSLDVAAAQKPMSINAETFIHKFSVGINNVRRCENKVWPGSFLTQKKSSSAGNIFKILNDHFPDM
jgi:hypothetical protein